MDGSTRVLDTSIILPRHGLHHTRDSRRLQYVSFTPSLPSDMILGHTAYAFLDPQTQHGKVAAYIVGIAVGEAIIFILVRYAILLRGRIFKFSSYHDQDIQGAGKEALDEWEEVQWNEVEGRESAGSNATNPRSGKPGAEVEMSVAV